MKTAELTVIEQMTDKGPVITVDGELDLTTVGQLREILLTHANREQDSRVVIDLVKVEFIDSAGLALLVEARKRMAADGRAMFLIITQGKQPERVLRLVRFDTIMKLVYNLDEVPAI
jgi:anti-sigma B factor antagonist